MLPHLPDECAGDGNGFLQGYWAAAGGAPQQVLALQARANTSLAAAVQAAAASANMGALGQAGLLDALTALRLSNIANAVLQTILGTGPAFPLSPVDMPFYRALLNQLDLSLVTGIAGIGAMRGLIGRLATLGLQAAGAADAPPAPGQPPAPGSPPAAGEPQGCVFCGATRDTAVFRGRQICRRCRVQLQGDEEAS